MNSFKDIKSGPLFLEKISKNGPGLNGVDYGIYL